MSTAPSAKVIPAHLDFLAIYNPELGRTEATERDQIVFYYSSKAEKRKQKKEQDVPTEKDEREEFDEQMRQVGLAQGILNFAKSFSDGDDVDSVETEKHRIVVTELESGWWVLASICLTVLPRQAGAPTALDPQGVGSIEYSSREVSPPQLLLAQLLRAHKVFLLHHSPNLSDQFVRLPREKFVSLLSNFWSPFAASWDVLLHGNPAVEAYDGIKLAAGGELGVGVGEEDWGSGERAVLEDLIQNTDGLVDVVVSRFGDAPLSRAQRLQATSTPTHAIDLATGNGWLNCLQHAAPADGMLFSGSGALSRHSLHSLTAWMEWVYTHGELAYGVRENPSSGRRRRKRRTLSPRHLSPKPEPDEDAEQPPPEETPPEQLPDIPRPIITAAEEALENAINSADLHHPGNAQRKEDPTSEETGWMSYLTLGYGSSWLGGSKAESKSSNGSSMKEKNGRRPRNVQTDSPSKKTSIKSALTQNSSRAASFVSKPAPSEARFLIGLQGDLEREPEGRDGEDGGDDDNLDDGNRISIRTVHMEIHPNKSGDDNDSRLSSDSISSDMMPDRLMKWKRLRLVVYVHQPFMFALLFEPTTDSLSMPSFFYSLHHYLLPLYKPLLNSTSPTAVALRLQSDFSPLSPYPPKQDPESAIRPQAPLTSSPIYDLIYSPSQMTIHSSIPNIPLPGTLAAEGIPTAPSSAAPFITPPWTRVEALNVHAQILTAWDIGRRNVSNKEQSAKTSRGWWVCWMRMDIKEEPAAASQAQGNDNDMNDDAPLREQLGGGMTMTSYETQRQANYREAILIRRATGATGLGAGGNANRNASSGSFAGMGSGFALNRWTGGLLGSSSGSDAAGQDAKAEASSPSHGLGVDARKYVESLLSLNR